MLDTEEIIQSGKASIKTENNRIKGKLHLTPDSLIFISNIDCKKEVFEIPLSAICKIETSELLNMFSKKLLIRTYKDFLVLRIDYPHTWRQLIEEQSLYSI